MHRRDVNNFGEANYPLPPSCLVSVYGSPNAVPSLHYAVPLVGVADSLTLHINKSLRTAPSKSKNKYVSSVLLGNQQACSPLSIPSLIQWPYSAKNCFSLFVSYHCYTELVAILRKKFS